ncbi:MAG TPA: condensation domain-containing protein, partial [Ktedonobacteraceae bacterium]
MWKDSEFLHTEESFQTILRECEYFTKKYAKLSIEEVLRTRLPSPSDEMLSPLASFVLQVALAEHWRSWGIIPGSVTGNGWGALAAAYIAGAITMEEAIRMLLPIEAPIGLQRTTRYDLYTGSAGFFPKGTSLHEMPWSQGLGDLDFSNELQQFERVVQDGNLLLEFGPSLQAHGSLVRKISMFHQGHLSKETLLQALGLLYMQDFSVHWPALYDKNQHCVTLPSFPWQRETVWPGWLTTEIISTPPESQSALLQAETRVQPVLEHDLSLLPLEEALAVLWAEVLMLKSVDIHESFFELGGHSLLAAQLIARIQKVFHTDISLSTLLNAPTPATCAQAIRQQQGNVQKDHVVTALPAVKYNPEQRYEPFALTDVQLAYWVGRSIPIGSSYVGNHAYIEVEAYRLDIARFNRAMQRLIQRHEMLRAVLLPGGQQRILETVPPFAATIVNLQEEDTLEAADRLRQIRQEMDHQLISVEQWPAFDIRIILLAEGRCQIHLSIESLFVDAWSMHLLIEEFAHFYFHSDTPLPALELSFRDYILTERALRETELYKRSEHYWKQRISSLPPAPDLPLTHNAISETPLRFVHHQACLDADDWKRLKARAAQVGLTPSGILLAAFAEILGTWSKSARFSINISLFNRLSLHPQVHDIVGDFTSLTVFAVDNTTCDTFEKRARRIQEQLWNDLDHSYYNGIHVLRELAAIQGNMVEAVMPIVFTSLLIQDVAYHSPVPWQETIYALSQTPQVWLDHQVLESQGALVFHWQVVEELFPEGFIEAMFCAYTRLLQRLTTEEDLWQASNLQLLPREQLEQRMQGHESSVLQEDCLLQDLFTRQVYKQPERIAVITPHLRLSYGEVYSTALLLAERLKQAGAKPGHCVG